MWMNGCDSLQGEQCVLMSVITGEAQATVRDLEDKEVVELCMNVLRELYKEQVRRSEVGSVHLVSYRLNVKENKLNQIRSRKS